MEKRIPYRVYKKSCPTAQTVPGSYDSVSKSIVIIMPEPVKHLRFNSSEWEASGNHKRLRGHDITVLYWNAGDEAHFELEAHETTDRLEREFCFCINGFDPHEDARHIYRAIPGFGPAARDEAIRQARALGYW